MIMVDKLDLNMTLEAMCDKYCKYPNECDTQEKLDEICNDCPLNNFPYWKEIKSWRK